MNNNIKNIRLQFTRWDDLPAEVQSQFASFMGDDPNAGQALYEHYFYWFNIPHQIGHVLRRLYQNQSENMWGKLWEEDMAANQLAVSYWRAKGHTSRLFHLENQISEALRHIPDPVPASEDRTVYINRNREKMDDPVVMVHYQFNMVRSAVTRPLEFPHALRKLVSSRTSDGITIPLSRDFPLDEDLPYRTVNDMQKTLQAYGLELPDIQVICMYSPAIQFIAWDGEEK